MLIFDSINTMYVADDVIDLWFSLWVKIILVFNLALHVSEHIGIYELKDSLRNMSSCRFSKVRAKK